MFSLRTMDEAVVASADSPPSRASKRPGLVAEVNVTMTARVRPIAPGAAVVAASSRGPWRGAASISPGRYAGPAEAHPRESVLRHQPGLERRRRVTVPT